MAPPKKQAKKQTIKAPVYNDICYLADTKSPPDRCNNKRLHYYIEAWLGYADPGEEYYEYVYKNKVEFFTSLGSADSFEQLLRILDNSLSGKENKGKMIGDLIILTHGKEYYDLTTQKTETVKIMLPLFSGNNPDGSLRSLPMWNRPSEIDTEELEKLQEKNSDYYKYVDKEGKKDGLISVVVKNIANYMDNSTHIWFVGCALGLNRGLLKAIRKLFSDKPVIYALNKKHYIYINRNRNNDISGGYERVYTKDDKRGILLWTKEGMQSIVHEP